MATGAAEMMRRCVFDGSISLHDSVIERRPYHRNCTCALHKLKDVSSDKVCFHRRTVAFPTKTSLTDCSLCISSFEILFSFSELSGEDRDNLYESVSGRRLKAWNL